MSIRDTFDCNAVKLDEVDRLNTLNLPLRNPSHGNSMNSGIHGQ